MLVPQWIAREHLKTFTTHLLFLPKLSHPYLSQAASDLLTSLLSESDDIDPDEARETTTSVLEMLAANPPSRRPTCAVLAQRPRPNLPWSILTLCHQEWTSIHTHTQPRRRSTCPKIGIWHSHTSNRPQKFVKAQRKYSSGSPNASYPFYRTHPHPFTTLEGGLTSLACAPALGNVLRTLEGLIVAFAAPWSDAVKKSSAQEYFGEVVRKVGEMRVRKGFQYRKGADSIFSAFAQAAGVDGLLSLLPLNLVPEEVSCHICSVWVS